MDMDSSTFGLGVYQFDGFDPSRATTPDPSGKGEALLLVARLPSGDIDTINSFQRSGFLVREVSLHPNLQISDNYLDLTVDERLLVAEVELEDLPEIVRIAGAAFSISRFYREPKVGATLAGRRYENWVKSSFLNPSHRVLKGTNEYNEIIGFFIITIDSGVATWLLTAMSDKFRAAGLTEKLWRLMIKESYRLGSRSIKTTISSENVKVVGLYPKLGFRFSEPSWVLHRSW
jgi:RimJ/RimL family protein N-acetyltransferase